MQQGSYKKYISQDRRIIQDTFSFISEKTHIKGTRWEHLNETFPMSTLIKTFDIEVRFLLAFFIEKILILN